MKILYCIIGNLFYGVLESDIILRNELVISAKRVFLPQFDPSQTIQSPKGTQVMKFSIIPLYNVWMSCNLIADMTEEEHFRQFYQEIIKFIEKEASHEN